MRRWCVILTGSDDLGLPNVELRRCWTERGAWRWVWSHHHPDCIPAHQWLEVRRVRDAMLTHDEFLTRALTELAR